MKKIILLLSLMVFFGGKLLAQADVVTAFTAIQPVNLPYYGTKTDGLQKPQLVFHFPAALWGSRLNINLWKDFGLTVPLIDNEFVDWVSIYRRFIPSNGSYYLGVIAIGVGDNGKRMLVTATSAGAYIDALEVSVGGYYGQ